MLRTTLTRHSVHRRSGYLSAALALLAGLILSACGSTAGPGGFPLPGDGQITYNPPVTLPPVESYQNLAPAGASAGRRWIDNSYDTLPQGASPFQNASLQAWSSEISTRINNARSAAGLPPLVRSPLLERLAQAHARDMGLRNFFSHTTPEGLSIWDRTELVGAPAYSDGGETNARGQESAAGVASGWLSSAEHRQILLAPGNDHIGVGVYFDSANSANPIHATAVLLNYN